MKISCFTFLRNADILGYPFVESIKSALPLCDEYIVNIGDSEDNTLAMIKAIESPKIKIIESKWNENMKTKGYVYAQQKDIAHFNCNGDWAFYLEADEIIHENDIQNIREAMEKYFDDKKIEGLFFDYIHFYGDSKTYIDSPGWYRKEVRIIKNNIRSYSPDGLFFVVLTSNKRGRYPKATSANAKIYHYGWIRKEEKMNEKAKRVSKYWNCNFKNIDYSQIDPVVLKEFKGSHPNTMKDWLSTHANPVFKKNPSYILTKKEKKHRLLLMLERIFKIDLSKRHFIPIRR